MSLSSRLAGYKPVENLHLFRNLFRENSWFESVIVSLAPPWPVGHSARHKPIVNLKTPTEAGDVIHIEQLEVFARIGVPDDERAAPQRLVFNITFWRTDSGSEMEDDIARTVNYAAVCAETKSFVQGRSDRLIETLADALANRLLGIFEVRRITIELRKFILPDVRFVSVTVTRERLTK